jgi:hypothetical protein
MMLRRFGIAFCLALICILVAPIASAQTCNTLILSADIGDFADQMKNTDPATVDEVLDDMEHWIAQQRAACVPRSTDTGLQARPGYEAMYTFSSDEEGSEAVLGPLYMPGGLYRVRLIANGAISAKLEEVEGSCYLLSIFDLFAIFELDKQNTVERVIYTDACEANINVVTSTGSWTIEVSEYLDSDVVQIEDSYSSETLGSMPVIGPILFDDGSYEFTLTTAGYMILNVQPLSGDCETEFSGNFIGVRPGEASNGVKASLNTFNCIAFLTMDNVSDPWTITVQETDN